MCLPTGNDVRALTPPVFEVLEPGVAHLGELDPVRLALHRDSRAVSTRADEATTDRLNPAVARQRQRVLVRRVTRGWYRELASGRCWPSESSARVEAVRDQTR